MNQTDFPLILSPNLGCPEIFYVEELRTGNNISLVVAWQCGEFNAPLKKALGGNLFLRPSYGDVDAGQFIPLHLAGEPEEIKDWNLLSDLSGPEDTRNLINSELHYNVLGEGTSYWKVEVSVKAEEVNGYEKLLTKERGGELYDLVLRDVDDKWERVNYHALHFVESTEGESRFILLTDLHTAKRNDEILDEVLKTKLRRSRSEIKESFINFNEKFREFIVDANKLADRGELDFIVIKGRRLSCRWRLRNGGSTGPDRQPF